MVIGLNGPRGVFATVQWVIAPVLKCNQEHATTPQNRTVELIAFRVIIQY